MRRTKEQMLAARSARLEEARKGLRGRKVTANEIFQYAFIEGWKARGDALNRNR